MNGLPRAITTTFIGCLAFFLFQIKGTAQLNYAEYLKLADGDKIYPTAKQLEMLKLLLPDNSFMPAPAYSDRAYWQKIADSESGKAYLKEAISMISKKPEIPISDAVYREANLKGNRGMYKPKYYNTMERLEHFLLAECLENQGRFLPQITVYIQAIMDMKSWLHPNHDDKENSNLEGKSIAIDLGARKFGSVLALANSLLTDKLSTELRNQIKTIVDKRITQSYLSSCKGESTKNTWIKATSNWNSVCTSGTLLATLSNSDNKNERLAAVGAALNSMKYYLSGFGSDGYCSEGAGYWEYGFGHYLYMAKILYDYTGGKINLFDAHDPQKLKNVGNFIRNFEIHNGTCAPFSDGVSSLGKGTGSNFGAALSAAYYSAIKPPEFRFEEAAEQIIAWNNPQMFTVDKNAGAVSQQLPDYSYFDDVGMVISRGKQPVPFSIAVKAGHNAENHNHDDVGTYVIFLGNDLMTGDIGAPSYTAGSFDKSNPARSSWGHPVPRVDNKLQSNGKAFAGKVINTEFNTGHDKVMMDLKAGYEIPSLKKLVRSMDNDKSGAGTISVKDEFVSAKPVAFGVAIMTYAKYEIMNDNTIMLTSKNQKVKAEVFANGGPIKIVDEIVPVKALREGSNAHRIGVDFTKPVAEGSIMVRFTPVN